MSCLVLPKGFFKTPPGLLRRWLRRLVRLTGWVIILLLVVVLFWLRGALYHHFVTFPREAAAWQALRLRTICQTGSQPGASGQDCDERLEF